MKTYFKIFLTFFGGVEIISVGGAIYEIYEILILENCSFVNNFGKSKLLIFKPTMMQVLFKLKEVIYFKLLIAIF